MSEQRRYHHGNLREAVIDAALTLLNEKGVEGVTLRQCAARAGVSHGAPGHHFGDIRGLLTAIAAIGYNQLADEMKALRDQTEPRDSLFALGVGYMRFAIRNPAHYSLMYQPSRLIVEDPELKTAVKRSFTMLAEEVASIIPDESRHRSTRQALTAMVHGYASLCLSGQVDPGEDIWATMRSLLGALSPDFRQH